MKAELEKLTIKLPSRTLEFTAEEYEALKEHFEAQRVLPLKEYIPCPYPYPVYPQPYYQRPWYGTIGNCGNDITFTAI